MAFEERNNRVRCSRIGQEEEVRQEVEVWVYLFRRVLKPCFYLQVDRQVSCGFGINRFLFNQTKEKKEEKMSFCSRHE